MTDYAYIIGKGYANKVINSNEAYCEDVAKELPQDRSEFEGYTNFQKHEIYIEGRAWFQGEEMKTLNWQVKNITKNVVIDSGTWQYVEDEDTGFDKNITTTQNYVGDTLRLTLWVNYTASKIFVFIIINTYFTK